ncbi:branched-chain amino acid transporter permease [Sulfurospirillum sp. 1612]|uniref:branched-chain amino acid transporter permease n=1 Tax=Sulfurospirillum sp. 1612 TaxID=3094835 RepID=UPI002F933C34
MSHEYLIAAIAIAAIATYITRITPFLFFGNKPPSATIRYIEWNMPIMIMVILVFYALKDVKWALYPFGVPEIIGVFIAVVMHLKYSNALLSIISATLVYMFLVQKIFV